MISSDGPRSKNTQFYPWTHHAYFLCLRRAWKLSPLGILRSYLGIQGRGSAAAYKTSHSTAVSSPRTWRSHSVRAKLKRGAAMPKSMIDPSTPTLIIIHSHRHAVCPLAGGAAHSSRAWSVGGVLAQNRPKNTPPFLNVCEKSAG